MDILFKNILEQLDTLDTLKWIDMDEEQLETPEDSYPVQFPCILIDISEAEWKDQTRGVQLGDVLVKIRLAFDLYHDTNNHTPTSHRNTGLEKLQVMNQVHQKLQGFSGNHFNSLTRVRTEKEKHEKLKVYSLYYKTNLRDANGLKQTSEQTVENLNLQATWMQS